MEFGIRFRSIIGTHIEARELLSQSSSRRLIHSCFPAVVSPATMRRTTWQIEEKIWIDHTHEVSFDIFWIKSSRAVSIKASSSMSTWLLPVTTALKFEQMPYCIDTDLFRLLPRALAKGHRALLILLLRLFKESVFQQFARYDSGTRTFSGFGHICHPWLPHLHSKLSFFDIDCDDPIKLNHS